ncbi:Centromere protein Scm3 [Ascosphaera apis ARSEF 7405]|uniref:Centromere protein Scm3 n=1 Tax=Ascosphaera apis ARSEF 7405 TaxID=392613 RepID=A0A167YYI2_9EURO|nr:Centromere protein Scm3 [Ascosphaera apis ARSEF 7405]
MEYANLADHQAGPRKRQRTSYGANDAQRGRASRQLDDFDLFEARMRSVKHLQSTFEDIIQRYGKDFPEDDEIDLRTGDITVNNGHIARLHQAEFGDGFGGYEESESDSSGHLDVEDRIQPGRLRGIRSMICPMDPPWSSSGFQDITSLRSKNSAQSQHTTAAYTRKRNHRRHSYPGDSVVFTRRRVFFSPEEIKLLVMLKRDNASWDEVYRALPHRPTLSIRQWYRKLEYKDEVPEEWLPRDQEILESLVTSNAEMFWEDLFERFNRVSHRKLKNLWLNTCLSMAGLQPSQCWRWLPNHGPGGEQGEMAVNPQQTVRSPEVIELLSSPVSHAGIERGGPEQTVDDEGSVGPVLYPDPAEDYYNNQQHSPPRSSNGDHFQILLSPGPINRNASASLENRGSFTGYLPISDKQLLADHPHPTDSGEHDTSFSIQQKRGFFHRKYR